MSKDSSNKDRKGEGVKLVGNPEKMIELLLMGDEEKKWTTDHIVDYGSRHKQVLTAMLLKRLYKLVQTIEKSSGIKFVMQEGFELKLKKDDEGKKMVLPVIFPINLGSSVDGEKIIKVLSNAPEHEALVYAIYMQVVEWAIKASAKNAQS